MRLQGRLTGHFLGRVVVLIGGLGTLFVIWLIGVSIETDQIRVNRPTPVSILRDAAADTTLTATGEVVLSAETSTAVQGSGYWLQVLDETGTVIAAMAAPEAVPEHYTPGNLVLYRQSPTKIGQRAIYTWAETIGGRDLTFVLGKPEDDSAVTVYLGAYSGSPDGASLGDLVAVTLGSVVFVLAVAMVFARGITRPMNHMMNWLGELADGNHAEPRNRRGRPVSRTRDGRYRRKPYRTYREVFDSLDTLTAELGHAEQERARIEAAREEWIEGVTHDLRTPLTSVRGYADLLASDYEFEPDEVRRQAGIIAGQAGHMDALIDDLTLTFRLSADALPLAPERVDLIEFARDAAVDLANDPRAAAREVVFEDPPGIGTIDVEVDPALFRRALANLLTNAAVHNREGTVVRVSVAREGYWALVRIVDSGSGMDEATLARLFDRYYRGTSTQSVAEGSGLGMAIARQIVEAHGGVIQAASTPGAGTAITVCVPAAG